MLGKRGAQRGLFEADTAYGAFVGRDSFYGWLASQRGELFRDEEYAGLYVLDNGRPSVPPSLLATALVLQAYAGVPDDEARQRAAYDLRWKVALWVELDARPYAKSTLQEFRAQLIGHEQAAGDVPDEGRAGADVVPSISPVDGLTAVVATSGGTRRSSMSACQTGAGLPRAVGGCVACWTWSGTPISACGMPRSAAVHPRQSAPGTRRNSVTDFGASGALV